MSRLLNIAIAAAFLLSLAACAEETPPPATDAYDAALAAELGADDYGMRSYVLVMLRTGPNDATITDKAEREKLFAGHFSNMGAMAEAGKLVFAGPVSGDKDERGIFVFNVASIDEAKTLLVNDPTVAAGIFVADYMNYYGSAALMKVNEIHATIQKKKIE